MEVQVMVSAEGGELQKGTWKDNGRDIPYVYWTDGTERWKPFRIPWKADSEPEYTDRPLRWDFAKHVEAIGLTGWDWQERCSRWVGFDFDSIAGHAEGLTDEQLLEVQRSVENVPWVTVRRSKSGSGIHLYVFLDPVVPTANHTEHAALARALLFHLSGLIGVALRDKVDKFGGVLWIWHRSTKPGGLVLVKQGVPLDHVPPNWKEHRDVVAGRRRRVARPVEESDLFTSYRHVQLDDEHKALLAWFDKQGDTWWWDGDHHMLVCHTVTLKRAHGELKLRGPFETIATGKDLPNDQNCFAFPKTGGGWTVRRHGNGTKEHPLWRADPTGWTRCELNVEPDLMAAVRFFGALESSKGEWVFENAVDAVRALNLAGAKLDQLPKWAHERRCTVLPKKREPKVTFRVAREKGDENLEGFLIADKARVWERVVYVRVPSEEIEVDDELVRHVVASGKDAGLFLQARQRWVNEPRANVLSALVASGMAKKEAEVILGQAVANFWELVTVPFAATYPGNRQWNRDAPQLAFDPQPGMYPTWDRILKHVGAELTPAVEEHRWCRNNGIATGADYLMCWIASLFQHPTEPLPYLFLHSTEESTGKSVFHESLSLLFADKRGYVHADSALTSAFNGELTGAVLCVVEELDLKKAKGARDRIKDFVTSPAISIHAKFTTPFMARNTTHWIQCANNMEYCPVFPGDTRITTIYVNPPKEMIPKAELIERLTAEGPAFLNAVLAFDLPPRCDRLRIPVIATGSKEMAEELSKTLLQEFIEEKCYRVLGARVKLGDFYDQFIAWLPREARPEWTKQRLGKELPHWAPRGRMTGGVHYVGNITFDVAAVPGARLVRVNNMLRETGE